MFYIVHLLSRSRAPPPARIAPIASYCMATCSLKERYRPLDPWFREQVQCFGANYFLKKFTRRRESAKKGIGKLAVAIHRFVTGRDGVLDGRCPKRLFPL